MNIAVVFNARKNNGLENIFCVTDTILKFGIHVFMLEEYSKNFSGLNITFCGNLKDLISSSDVVLAIGGDGTIMHTAKLAAEFDKPVLGVNSGRLGFMASIEKNQIDKLSELVGGNYKISKHILLEVKHENNKLFALNDVVINRTPESQILDYKICKFSESVCSYRADGIIAATPTGSTAYSLSAGGPIVQSDMDCIIITPICAHSLYARSMVLDSDEPITIEYDSDNNSKIFVSVDGQVCFSDSAHGKLEIKKTNSFAKFIVLGHNGFYRNLDKKLLNKNYPNLF